MDWLAERIAKAERVATPLVIENQPNCLYQNSLVPYRHTWETGQSVIVRFDEPEQEQRAFNMVASLLPEGVKLKSEAEGGPRWFYLEAKPVCGDPMGQCGYIGWKWLRDSQTKD